MSLFNFHCMEREREKKAAGTFLKISLFVSRGCHTGLEQWWTEFIIFRLTIFSFPFTGYWNVSNNDTKIYSFFFFFLRVVRKKLASLKAINLLLLFQY